MSKSVLVIDTPENCNKCKFIYHNYWNDKYCSLTKGTEEYVGDYTKYRSPKCPLSPLPSSIDLKQYVDNAELNMESMLAYQYAQGWNDFREEISKGVK